MGSGIHRIRLLSTGCSTAVTCSFFVILPSCALRFFFSFFPCFEKSRISFFFAVADEWAEGRAVGQTRVEKTWD